MSNRSRWRGYPPLPPPRDGGLRPGIDPDPGRDGSPYTFEGSLARGWNIVGSLTSRDPEFRRKAVRRMTFFWAVMLLPSLLVGVALLLRVLS